MNQSAIRRVSLSNRIGIAVLIITCAAVSGCASSPDKEIDMSTATEALDESLAMVEGAIAESGGTAEAEVTLVSTKNPFGAPDGKSLAIEVYALVDEPVDQATLVRIKEQWAEEFGFVLGPDDGEAATFTKGDRTATVGNNAASVGGPGRTWFAVTTEFFDPDAARAAVGSP